MEHEAHCAIPAEQPELNAQDLELQHTSADFEAIVETLVGEPRTNPARTFAAPRTDNAKAIAPVLHRGTNETVELIYAPVKKRNVQIEQTARLEPPNASHTHSSEHSMDDCCLSSVP